MTVLKTPGVYINEVNAFANSIVQIPTSVAIFIGYTEKAERSGKSLLGKATRIESFAEYQELFGGGFKAKFTLVDATSGTNQQSIVVNGAQKAVKINDHQSFYLFNSLRMFYSNGGGVCYILPVGLYGNKKEGVEMKADDFIAAISVLEKEIEPDLVVMPDAIALGTACYDTVYAKILEHCNASQNRFAILDLTRQTPADTRESVVNTFREKIGTVGLKCGAAYYPWGNTSVMNESEVTFANLDDSVGLEKILTEKNVTEVIEKYKQKGETNDSDDLNYHGILRALSPTYVNILTEIRAYLNELPFSGAMAGIYGSMDQRRGIWKAPANVSVAMVNSPTIKITSDEQQNLNVDANTGKSINVIRLFPGIGTMVWGARTLDGNSNEWKYINVRRTLTMIEQSIKLSTRAFVFEPNDANTWVSVKSMTSHFLTNLWKQGALAGADPDQAFQVHIGLGTTMTGDDILNGVMRVTVNVAIVRPAEFMVITFEQMMQSS